jgi:hypothetical protein
VLFRSIKNEKLHGFVRKLTSNFTPENTNKVHLHHWYSGIPANVGKDIMKSKTGSIHYNPGFHSFTSHESPSVALDFASGSAHINDDYEPEYHIIHAKKIHPGVMMSIAHHSLNKNENEGIMKPGQHSIYHGTEVLRHPDGIGKIFVHHMEYIDKHEDHEKYGS